MSLKRFVSPDLCGVRYTGPDRRPRTCSLEEFHDGDHAGNYTPLPATPPAAPRVCSTPESHPWGAWVPAGPELLSRRCTRRPCAAVDYREVS